MVVTPHHVFLQPEEQLSVTTSNCDTAQRTARLEKQPLIILTSLRLGRSVQTADRPTFSRVPFRAWARAYINKHSPFEHDLSSTPRIRSLSGVSRVDYVFTRVKHTCLSMTRTQRTAAHCRARLITVDCRTDFSRPEMA